MLPPGGDQAEPFALSTYDERQPAVSPNGHWMAYVSEISGAPEVYVERFPEGGQQEKISSGGGDSPQWAPNGQELFYRDDAEMIMVPVMMAETDFDFGDREVLFDATDYRAHGYAHNYDVHSDGRFLMIEALEGGSQRQINVVVNWFEELKRLARTGR